VVVLKSKPKGCKSNHGVVAVGGLPRGYMAGFYKPESPIFVPGGIEAARALREGKRCESGAGRGFVTGGRYPRLAA
jgi:hypothetical protein